MSQQYPQGPQPQYPIEPGASGGPGAQSAPGMPGGPGVYGGPGGPQFGGRHGMAGKPPKKPFFKRTWVIVTGAVLALFVVIGIANSGGGSTTASTTDLKASAPAEQPAVAKPPASTKPATKPGTKSQPTKAPATKAPATQAPVQAEENTTCDGSRNDPCPVRLGVAFTVGKHQLQRGWKLKSEEYVGTKLVGKLTNVSDEPSTAFFSVRFLKGDDLVANFQCSSSSELQPRQSEAIECFNLSDVEKTLKKGSYDKITAQADF